MLNWLMLALVSGAPTGLQSGDIEELASGLSTDVHLLEPVLERRVGELEGRPELAADTMHLLAPLAERVGLGHQRAALEDEAFRVLEPEAYAALVQRLPWSEDDVRAQAVIETELRGLVPAENKVASRIKSLWSLQKKMRRKGVDVDEIYDRLAFRVVVDDEPSCYAVLGRLLADHAAVDGELDDYIAQPKPSGYQALHAALTFDVDGREVVAEVQIKTAAMHAAAEVGPAAHWRYKAA